jgi:hypothetical protein
MSSLVFRDREGDSVELGRVPMLCSTLPGVVIGELGIDECLPWEEPPASCMYAMPTESGVWERTPRGMRIEISPRSTHGCPNTIFSSTTQNPQTHLHFNRQKHPRLYLLIEVDHHNQPWTMLESRPKLERGLSVVPDGPSPQIATSSWSQSRSRARMLHSHANFELALPVRNPGTDWDRGLTVTRAREPE